MRLITKQGGGLDLGVHARVVAGGMPFEKGHVETFPSPRWSGVF